MQDGFSGSAGPDLVHGGADQLRTCTVATRLAQDGDPLDLGSARSRHAPAHRTDRPAIDLRQEVGSTRIVRVELDLERHPLLIDEHGLADREAPLAVGLVGDGTDQHRRHG